MNSLGTRLKSLGSQINAAKLREPRTQLILAFVAGLIVGLVALGWWLFPVSWEDASAEQLRADLRADYLRAAIDSYTLRPDDTLARQRLDALGDAVDETMATVESSFGQQAVESIAHFHTLMGGEPASPTTGAPAAEGEPLFSLGTLFTYLCGITLVLGLALGVLYVVRTRQSGDDLRPNALKGRQRPAQARAGQQNAEAEAPPLSQWMTNYVQGDDLYDDSYSIDSPAGEFMGECGVSIAETIGVGSPKRVSAFEIWLFDKNDIQTVTKVLMSSHVFRDDASRERLAAKGEPVLASPGAEAVLETATLQMVARVVDMQYGAGPMPEESFFERATLELAVWSKV
ncbi:MAG: hypothetical protein WEA61_08855 [Anaerolineales bacterium]